MNINFLAPMNSMGYGVAAQKLLEALVAEGHEVALFPIGGVELGPAMLATYNNAVALGAEYDSTAPSVRMFHQDNLAEHVGQGRHIGFPFFELNKFTFAETHHLNQLDTIFVASEWAKEVLFTEDVGKTVHVVPLGVDRSVFHEGLRKSPRMDDDTTVFINIGKWEVRKGHDKLLSAFNKAFQPTDNVHLRMINRNPFIGQMNDLWTQMYETSPMASRIRVERGRLGKVQHVAQALAFADCAVFPARAEGWNLEALEMLATGGHVIATNYAGHTEYLSKANALLIDPTDLEPALDGVWFHGQGDWATFGEPEEEQLIEHLRAVHRTKQCGELKLNEAGISTSKAFSWKNSAERFVKGLI